MYKMEREEKRHSLYSTQVTHPVRAYPGFLSMKRLGLLLIIINPHPPPDGMPVHHKVTPPAFHQASLIIH